MPYGNKPTRYVPERNREREEKREKSLYVKPFEHCSGTRNYERESRMIDCRTKQVLLRKVARFTALYLVFYSASSRLRYLRNQSYRYRHGYRGYHFPGVIVSS